MVFGGIIRTHGRLTRVDNDPHRVKVDKLDASFLKDVQLGDSIAINGVCLTVVHVGGDARNPSSLLFDVSDETLTKTTLGCDSFPCTQVHVERALAYGDAIGGHVISGHVHNVGTITKLDLTTGDLIIALPPDRFPTIPVLKDSITIDGVSLTVAEVIPASHSIRIALIPHTIKETLFRELSIPAPVNVELHLLSGATWTPALAQTATTSARTDFEWMLEAVKEGEKGRFTAPPNPWVGAVLVNAEGQFLASGFHVRPGEPHAERNIDYAGSWEGCTLYVTLEPCCHHGRTPPCVNLLLEKKPTRVVVGTLDPDPRVAGNGVAELEKAGIKVDVGVAKDSVEFSLRAYLWHRSHNARPYVTAKLALSQDNCFAYISDTSKSRSWITGERARCHGHGLRAEAQKIVVGKNTKNMDQPKLDVRYNYAIDRQPEAVVSTRHLHWIKEGDAQTLNVLVEGGPELQNDLLQRKLINEFVLYRSTKVLGLQGIRWMPSFLDRDWRLVETKTFEDGDTMQRFVHLAPAETLGTHPLYEGQQRSTAGAAATSASPAGSWATASETPSGAGDDAGFDLLGDKDLEVTLDPSRDIQYDSIDTAITHLKDGGIVVVMDDAGRENEGDLMMLADRITLRNMKVFLSTTTGIVCATMTEGRAKQLRLPLMISNEDNDDKHRTKFTVTVDAAAGITTGVCAEDRVRTLSILADPSAKAADLNRPGHIFPLIAAPGGLLERRGHTEAGVELARLCGMEHPVMVISELYDHSTGKMLSARQCVQLGLPIIHVQAIKEASVASSGASVWCDLPLQRHGPNWRLAVVNGTRVLHHRPPTATSTTRKDEKAKKPLQIRIHSECFTGDVLGSALCDCGNQLHTALDIMSRTENTEGLIVFPPGHEGRGIGLEEKVKAYALQRGAAGLNTFEANRSLGHPDDARTYSTAIFAMKYLGFDPAAWSLQLLSENPAKRGALTDAGYAVDVLPFDCGTTDQNQRYLQVKREHFQAQQREGGSVPAATTASSDQAKQTAPEAKPASTATTSMPEEQQEEAVMPALRKMAPKPWVLSPDERARLFQCRVVIVQAEWHRHMSDQIVDVMTKELKEEYGITNVAREFAPGSFELPRIVQHSARLHAKSGVRTVFIAVGILVKGDTDHYDLVASETTRNLARIQLEDDIWVVNAVLACHTMKQVEERCAAKSDKCVGPHMAHAAAKLALQQWRRHDSL